MGCDLLELVLSKLCVGGVYEKLAELEFRFVKITIM